MKVWITKYTLTQGIFEKEVKFSTASDDMVVADGTYSECYHGEGREWHLTKEEAVKKAEEIKDRKIKSIQKQLEKLQNMKFE